MKPGVWIFVLAAACLSACAQYRYAPSSTLYSEPNAISNYAMTRAQARQAVFAYCDLNCIYYSKVGEKPVLPYRATFRRALAGDLDALHTLFTDTNYHSGDNEDWIDIHWAILHALGDEQFMAFLSRLTAKERGPVLTYLCYSIPEKALWPYFSDHFPRVSAIYRSYAARKGW